VARDLVAGVAKPADLERMTEVFEHARVQDPDLRQAMLDALEREPADNLAQLRATIAGFEEQQASRERAAREAEQARLEAERSAAETRAARREALLSAVSLQVWPTLDAEERADVLGGHGETGKSFDKQDNADLEWAQSTWEPVTGCLHPCTYCLPRDLANQPRMAEHYPHGFAPTLRPRTLLAPRGKKPPKEAATDARYRNVLTCWTADLFGPWVPRAWIEAVLREIADAPAWEFFCLTRFPERLAELDLPANFWIGATVDVQARVAATEAAFAKLRPGKRWLAVAPMLEPLRLTRPELFDSLVIGGAEASSRTPAWQPPFEWIAELVRQARTAGVPVYFQPSLLGHRLRELPFEATSAADLVELPAVFRRLDPPDGDEARAGEAA
jgi:protein gp37